MSDVSGAQAPNDTPLPEADKEQPEAEAQEGEQAEQVEQEAEGEKKPEQPEKPKRPGKLQRRIAALERQLAERSQREHQGEERRVEPEAPKPPRKEDFEDYGEYIVAKAKYDAKIELRQEIEQQARSQHERRQQQAAQEAVAAHKARVEKAAEKYADYDEVALDPSVPISDAMARVILHSESGPDIAYYLGKHRDEANRIAQMNPLAAAMALGNIQAKLSAVSVKKKTGAPPPPKVVTGAGKPKLGVSDDLSVDEWMRRRQKEARRA